MAQPMEIEKRSYTRTPKHLKRFSSITGCGSMKMKELAVAFPSEADLVSATLENFEKTNKIGKALAKKLFDLKMTPADQLPTVDIWNGSEREVVWNKVLGKKVSGAAAPKKSEVDVWLDLHSKTHERYTNQDKKRKGPNDVPEDYQMMEPEFEAHCGQEAVLDLNGAVAHALAMAEPYRLKPLALPAAAASQGPMSAGTLHFALLHAAASIDGDVDSLHKALKALMAQDGPSQVGPLLLLQTATAQLKRPAWVWTNAQPAGVFQCDGEDTDPMQVTPIRICLAGGCFFALVPQDHANEVPVTLADPDVVAHAELPDLKEDVDRSLADVQAQIDAISQWSTTHLEEPYELSVATHAVDELRARLTSGSGTYAAFLGNNNVGKSTIINLLILNSSIDEAAYKKRTHRYVPEALLDLSCSGTPPTHAQLVADPGNANNANLIVTILKPPPRSGYSELESFQEDEKLATEQYATTEADIKRYCEVGGNKPNIKRFALPCGEGGDSTTSLHTRVRFGSVVHLLAEHYSVDELKKQAFSFIVSMRDLDDEDPTDLPEPEQEALLEKWYVYLNIKNGPYKRMDLPRLSQMPSSDDLEARWQDIELCGNLLSIVRSPGHLYVGTGRSLHLDRMMVHDLVKKMNDKEQLYRYAIKSLAIYQPAAVLEGGNGFVDLPGQNEVDTGCTAQTREGVKEAGVVFVVLSKSLYTDKDSLRLLKETDTVRRAAAGEANVVFIFNREPQSDCKHRELETDYEKEVRATLEEKTRECWLAALLAANDKAKRDNDPHKTEDEIKQIAAHTPMRTIYPMLHSSYKLNWECAERHKTSEGSLSGSLCVFELSNVYWLLGILETLNRQSLIEQLKRIATMDLPALREKLKGSLEDAKNGPGGLSADLVAKAARMLKGRRTLDGTIGTAAAALSQTISTLGHTGSGSSSAAAASSAEASFRLQIDALIEEFVDDGVEVREYLERAERLSNDRWEKMSKQMKRMPQAQNAIDPRNKGNAQFFSLLPMIFGSSSRQVPFSFEPLVSEISAKLELMLEKVIDLVIERVDSLLGDLLGEASTTSLKESFVASDVIKPLQKRFSLAFFIKVKQRDPMLNDGKLDAYLKKSAVQIGSTAVKNKILSRASEVRDVSSIKNLIDTNRGPVRVEWQQLLRDGTCDFVGGQFALLINDLINDSKKTQGYSVKSMLIAFLKHIVNTDKMQRNIDLQQDLSGFITDLAFKTDSLHSLWARLDGQDDPCKLGTASARHVERRRQREQTQRRAREIFTLGTPNQTMPVTELKLEDISSSTLFELHKHLFQTSDEDQIATMKLMLRDRYRLDIFQRSGVTSDVFCAIALVAYKSGKLKSKAVDQSDPQRELTINEHITLAASQLRAVAAAQLSHYYRTDEAIEKTGLIKILGEPVNDYIERIGNKTYRGDLLCLWALATHFRRAFRVWVPGCGSVFIPSGPEPAALRSRVAFQLVLSATASTDDSPRAESYQPTWFPVQLMRSARNVSFANSLVSDIRELPMTDDDRMSRITQDPDTRHALHLPQGFAEGPLRSTPSAYSRKRPISDLE